MNSIETTGLAHELWALAQLTPGEGIEDAVARMVNALAATGKPVVAEPSDVTREALADLIAEHLSGTYHCTRVWSAWGVNTMSEDDFCDVDESDTPTEIADAILARFGNAATAEHSPVVVDLPLVIRSAPARIWLDLGFNPSEDGDAHFSNLNDLTWSANNATGDGIEYVRADLSATHPPVGRDQGDAEPADAALTSLIDLHGAARWETGIAEQSGDQASAKEADSRAQSLRASILAHLATPAPATAVPTEGLATDAVGNVYRLTEDEWQGLDAASQALAKIAERKHMHYGADADGMRAQTIVDAARMAGRALEKFTPAYNSLTTVPNESKP